jgi:hypothetical protein
VEWGGGGRLEEVMRRRGEEGDNAIRVDPLFPGQRFKSRLLAPELAKLEMHHRHVAGQTKSRGAGAVPQLVRLNLDGNPLGRLGARAIFRAAAANNPAAASSAGGGAPASLEGAGDAGGDEFSPTSSSGGGGGGGGGGISAVCSPVYGWRGRHGGGGKAVGALESAAGTGGDGEFDAGEAAGDYELDLRDPYGLGVLLKLVQVRRSRSSRWRMRVRARVPVPVRACVRAHVRACERACACVHVCVCVRASVRMFECAPVCACAHA